MKDDDLIETAGIDPFEFQLANGNNVKIVFARFWERLTDMDRMLGARPMKYFAIKIYSNEDNEFNRMAVRYVFRADHEFGLTAVPKIWDWLDYVVAVREHAKYDWLDEFVDDFAEKIAELTDSGEDAVEHLERLPEFTDPDAFDHDVDDSIYNDQNETDSPNN